MATRLLQNRHLLILSIAVILVGGLSALSGLPRIEDPRIKNRYPVIITRLPGATAERVEALVTDPIEDALREVPEVKLVESVSRSGVSVISVEFHDHIQETATAFAKVRDKIGEIESSLPVEATKPIVDDQRGAEAYTLIVGLTWTPDNPEMIGVLNRVADELADRLRNVGGTELVRTFGTPQEEITVTIDPDELAALGLTASDVALRIAAADAKVPSGTLRGDQSDLVLEVAGKLESVERIAAVPLREGAAGDLLRLGDLAEVRKSRQDPPREKALIDGKRGVFVAARMRPDLRVDQWAASAGAALDDFEAEFAHEAGGVSVTTVFDQSLYTSKRLGDLGSNLAAGAGVIMLVILLMMGWRASLVVSLALPLASSATLFGLALFGVPMHQMSMFGMIIALGLLIDNAIVVVDEVRSRLNDGMQSRLAVADAVAHLRVPLISSTLTTVLAFMPILLLNGAIGEFIGSISLSVILALVSSLAISLSIIAALAGLIGRDDERRSRTPRWLRSGVTIPALGRGYSATLRHLFERPVLAIAATCVLPFLGFALAGQLGNQFFPYSDRDQFQVKIWLPDSASLDNTESQARRADALIRDFPGVDRVHWLIGGSVPSVYYNMIMDQDANTGFAQAVVQASSGHIVKQLVPKLQEALDQNLPGTRVAALPFGQGPPVDAPVQVRVLGPDPSRLRKLGETLRAMLHEIPEVLHSESTLDGGTPKLWVDANEDEARLAGLSLVDIAAQLQGNLEGSLGGSVLEQNEELPVRIRYPDHQRADFNRLATSRLVTAETADWIPLPALGKLQLRPELSSLARRDGLHCNTIKAYIHASALPPEVNQAFLDRIDASNLDLPPGYRLEVGGDAEEQASSIAQLVTYVPVLAILMVATLVLSFRSFVLAGLIGVVALLTIGMGLLSVWISGYPFGFNPIIGTAGLIGVALNDSIVVLAAIRANKQSRRR